MRNCDVRHPLNRYVTLVLLVLSYVHVTFITSLTSRQPVKGDVSRVKRDSYEALVM